MEQILLSRYARKVFFFVASILFLVLLLVRLFVVPTVSHFLDADIVTIIITILDSLFSTGISTLVIACLAFWLTPRIVKKSQMEIIQPQEIKKYLEQARNADEYWFSGGTGRFTRSRTIPKLALDARHSNFSKKIYLLLINPNNDRVCENYVNYRNKIRSGLKKNWDLEQLRKELLATIVSAYSWNREQPLLEINIGLIDHYSLFRVDLSNKLAVITKEDPSEPALMCEQDTFFFKSYLEDLRLSFNQSLVLGRVEGILFSELTGEKIKEFVTKLNLSTDNLDDSDFEEIAEIVKKGENPYGY